MTPLLVLVFGFHPATAVGTDLLYASATKAVGTGVHGFHGTVEWRVVRRMAMGSVPATILALILLSLVDRTGQSMREVLSVALGITLMLTAVAMFFRARLVAKLGPWFAGLSDRRVAAITIGLGVVLGITVSLTSVGAGALGMTALLILYPHLPVNRLVGSDIAHAVPLTMVAGIGHWAMGSVDSSLLVSLLAGSIPGIVIGSLLSARASDRLLTVILAVTLAVVGARMLF